MAGHVISGAWDGRAAGSRGGEGMRHRRGGTSPGRTEPRHARLPTSFPSAPIRAIRGRVALPQAKRGIGPRIAMMGADRRRNPAGAEAGVPVRPRPVRIRASRGCPTPRGVSYGFLLPLWLPFPCPSAIFGCGMARAGRGLWLAGDTRAGCCCDVGQVRHVGPPPGTGKSGESGRVRTSCGVSRKGPQSVGGARPPA